MPIGKGSTPELTPASRPKGDCHAHPEGTGRAPGRRRAFAGDHPAHQPRGITRMTVATALAPAARPNRLLWLLRRYPLLGYFLIAYAFTAAFDLLVTARFPDAPSFPRDFGPSVAALVLTAAIAGKPGLKRLLRRLVLWVAAGGQDPRCAARGRQDGLPHRRERSNAAVEHDRTGSPWLKSPSRWLTRKAAWARARRLRCWPRRSPSCGPSGRSWSRTWTRTAT